MIFCGLPWIFKFSAEIIKKEKNKKHCHCRKTAFETAPGRQNARFEKLSEVVCLVLELREEKLIFVKIERGKVDFFRRAAQYAKQHIWAMHSKNRVTRSSRHSKPGLTLSSA